MKSRFLVYLNDIASEVDATTSKDFFRGAMISYLRMHFWPELTKGKAGQLVDEWMMVREQESTRTSSYST